MTFSYEDCPDRVEVTSYDSIVVTPYTPPEAWQEFRDRQTTRPGRQWLCGCGRCPVPDPTPAELQQKIDHALGIY